MIGKGPLDVSVGLAGVSALILTWVTDTKMLEFQWISVFWDLSWSCIGHASDQMSWNRGPDLDIIDDTQDHDYDVKWQILASYVLCIEVLLVE